MNVLCVDVDSKIANLALMQASGYHKSRGDLVALSRSASVPIDAQFVQPEIAYVSCVFTWNSSRAKRIARAFPSSVRVLIGGTGVDLHARMPPWIESTRPDYDLYREDYALGFCVRGCNRRCEFCVVPVKEGRIDPTQYAPPSSWVPDWARKAMLLDNDLALYDDRLHDEILDWFKASGVKVSITQGYDIRCVTPERAALLADLKPSSIEFDRTRLYTAWDYLGIEGWVRKKLPLLLDAGFRPRQIMVYMIVGFNTTRDGDWYRFHVLADEFGVLPFVMPYNNRRDDPWIRAFTRWVNRGIYKFVPWSDYRGNPDPEWTFDSTRPRVRDRDATMPEFHALAQAE